ncbi:MAG: hypothetical protein P4L84_11110 [Isosphaeraceae bacterium]|nr:hypothetical protein [Isosphaeraceae bacterium]
MNPSPSAITAIEAFAAALSGGWAAHTDAQVLSAIQAATVANPIAVAAQLPNVLDESALIGLLNDPSNGSLAKLLNWVNFGLVKADIDASNRTGVDLWAQKLQLLSIITAGEAGNITTYLAGTTADPSWTATVRWDVGTLGRTIDLADVIAARAAQS